MTAQTSTRPATSIRFPRVKERTGYRRGPRYRLAIDSTGLHGARLCAARMVNSALLHRDAAPRAHRPEFAKVDRLGMRLSALWARVFAGQIDQHDPRLDATQAERHALVLSLAAQFSPAA